MSEVKCPTCGYEAYSWDDFVNIGDILECPDCENHFRLVPTALSEQPKLQIPKWVADIIDEAVPVIEYQDQYDEATGTLCPVSVNDLEDEQQYEEFEDWTLDNLELFTAYYNPLTRSFVEVAK